MLTTTIHIIPNTTGTPLGKLADADLHFRQGPLKGRTVTGFAVWAQRTSGRYVTFQGQRTTPRTSAFARLVLEAYAKGQYSAVNVEA